MSPRYTLRTRQLVPSPLSYLNSPQLFAQVFSVLCTLYTALWIPTLLWLYLHTGFALAPSVVLSAPSGHAPLRGEGGVRPNAKKTAADRPTSCSLLPALVLFPLSQLSTLNSDSALCTLHPVLWLSALLPALCSLLWFPLLSLHSPPSTLNSQL